MKADLSQIPGKLLEEILRIITEEGIHFARVRTIEVGLKVLRGIRHLFLFHFFALILCFLLALSLFSVIYLMSAQISAQGSLAVTAPLGASIGIFSFCAGIVYYAFREKTWLRLFQVERLVDQALRSDNHHRGEGSSLTPEEISSIVEAAVDRRLRELEKEKTKTGRHKG